MNPIVLSLFATIIVSLISLVGLFLYRFRQYSFIMVSFAVGALLGDAFIHILPESYRQINSTTVAWLLITGMLIFFSVEKFMRWRHCHDPECDDHIVSLSLVGDTVHNFIDGMIIAGSFLVNTHLGVVTTLAVILHEIPQEIGHFGIFFHHGLSLKKSLLFNLISAIFAILGCVFVLILGTSITDFSKYILPITAGGFIYLASSDLIPELHRHENLPSHSLAQIIGVILGFSLMALLLLVE